MRGQLDNRAIPRQLILPLQIRDTTPFWRPIHYLGSKLRLVNSIRNFLHDLDPTSGTVCDLFAGSGTVSIALSSERNVVAADVQEYSRVLCTALLKPALLTDSIISHLLRVVDQNHRRLGRYVEPILEAEQVAIERAPKTPTLLCEIVERGSLLCAEEGRRDSLSVALAETRTRIGKESHALMATRYFGGIYFSYHQTLFIDCVLAAIDQLPIDLRETCLAILLSTASSIVNSVGKQFAQPMQPRRANGTIKPHIIIQMCRDRSQDASKIFSGWISRYRDLPQGGSHRVIRGDYREVLSDLRDAAVIYADPPYTRDHYSRFYHVLETLCLRDSPEISTTLRTAKLLSVGGSTVPTGTNHPFALGRKPRRVRGIIFWFPKTWCPVAGFLLAIC